MPAKVEQCSSIDGSLFHIVTCNLLKPAQLEKYQIIVSSSEVCSSNLDPVNNSLSEFDDLANTKMQSDILGVGQEWRPMVRLLFNDSQKGRKNAGQNRRHVAGRDNIKPPSGTADGMMCRNSRQNDVDAPSGCLLR